MSFEPYNRSATCDTIECEQAELLISKRLDGELSAHELPLLEEHLKICGNCRTHSETWTDHSELIEENLGSLWPQPRRAGRAARTTAKKPARMKRCMWVPVGMLGSQVLAFLGLSIYFVFFQNAVEAPQAVHLDLPPAREVRYVSVLPVEHTRTPRALPTAEVPLTAAQTFREDARPALTEQRAMESLLEVTLAAPHGGMNFTELPKVSMAFDIAADDLSEERSGHISILGDPSTGKAVVRIVEKAGKIREIAQRDLDTLLEQPLRGMVKRFLEECTKGDVRERLQRAAK